MERKIEELSDIELKALAYDTLAQLQLFQQNLAALNNELAKRAQAARNQQPVITPDDVIPREGLGKFQST